MDVAADRARYEADRAKDIALAGTNGIDAVMKAQQARRAALPGRQRRGHRRASPGYPTVIVPFGMVPNAPTPPFPRGFNAKPAPFGVSFTGLACSEPRLIELAYAFEQATKKPRAAAAGTMSLCVRPIAAVALLLFGPAVIAVFHRTAGYVVAGLAVVALVLLVLHNEPPAGE